MTNDDGRVKEAQTVPVVKRLLNPPALLRKKSGITLLPLPYFLDALWGGEYT